MGIASLMDDAHRRVCIARQRGEAADLGRVWTGLAFPSEMKAARAFFQPVNGERPRCLAWYRFTAEGLAEYLRRYETAPDWFAKEESDA